MPKKQRKQIEETLLQHTSILENILDKAADGICVCHNILEEPYVKFTHWNSRMTEITGYTIEEINRLGWYQTIHPDPADQKTAIERMTQMLEGDDIQAEEWIITTKSGGEKALSISTSVVNKKNKKIHVLAVMQDITESKKSQDELKENEKKYKLIAHNSADVIYKISLLNEKVTYVSPSVERMLGYAPEEALSLTVKDVVTAASYNMQQEKLIQALEINQKTPEIMELEACHKDGHTVPVEIHASILYDEQGNPAEILGTVRDITRRKIAEKKLLQEKEKLEKALAEIKRLSGLLPICASCKKIRDDNGYWNQIESYIRDHSDAKFSHSLCPQCAKELYGEFCLDDDKDL